MATVARSPGADALALERFVDETAVVIVLYRRGLASSPTFCTLDAALGASPVRARLTLLVYDNSPVAGPVGVRVGPRWDLHHVHDPSNPGVSVAYRAGAALAERLGKRWLLFFDQDTHLPAAVLAGYAVAVRDNPGAVVFAPTLQAAGLIVSPCAYRFPVGRPLPNLAPGPRSLDGVSLLNSGLCVDRRAYAAVGGHNPRIPLDFSDHELVDRLRAQYPSFVLVPLALQHGLSAAEPQSVAQRLARFRAYCVGALRACTGPAGGVKARVVVVARGAQLTWRWRHPGFLMAGLRAGWSRG